MPCATGVGEARAMWGRSRRLVKNRALETEQFRRRAMLGFVIVALSLLA